MWKYEILDLSRDKTDQLAPVHACVCAALHTLKQANVEDIITHMTISHGKKKFTELEVMQAILDLAQLRIVSVACSA
jgi:hypothetical protein